MSFYLIETLDDLICLNKELRLKAFIGVDTEFRRTTKDNMRLALLQVNDAEEIYLIDTIAINDPIIVIFFLYFFKNCFSLVKYPFLSIKSKK